MYKSFFIINAGEQSTLALSNFSNVKEKKKIEIRRMFGPEQAENIYLNKDCSCLLNCPDILRRS